ncbi:hypothetical protein [Streptomyces acidicola]|uniref:hypothetical protein n=1 Tax=Streptomyces acidicola TaxID=2596892 RepID=UPI00380306B3
MTATEQAAPTGVPPCRALRHVLRFLAGLGPLAPCVALVGVAGAGDVELPEN